MKFKYSLIILLFITTCWYSCTPSAFVQSNKKYKKQAKDYAKIIRKIPVDSIVSDSLKMPSEWIGTTNFGLRKPNYVIIHHTAQNSCWQTIQTFTKESSQVSTHYVICKDGTLHHMLNNYLRAWHSGSAKWGNETDINSASIGIEIDNNGVEPFSEAQLNTLTGLLASLKKNYNIPTANFIGHGDIAPGRKIDPNVYFPWKRFAELGYGFWYNDTSNVNLPENFNPLLALRIIGYDVSNFAAAVQAYRRHFLQVEITGELLEPEKKVLYMLMLKFM